MNGKPLFPFRKAGQRSALNRVPSPLLARSVPWISVMIASLVPGWLFIASAPVMPPFGFLVLVAWMQLRPGLLPAWAGAPLGLFDDLVSGQPLGSGVLLWSLSIIVLEVIEMRLPWRNFLMEALAGAALIAAYLALGLGFANIAGASTPLVVIVPQILISVLLYPLVGRFVAGLDRLRLVPFVELG